jgi:ketosteroid isomerase-like protein
MVLSVARSLRFRRLTRRLDQWPGSALPTRHARYCEAMSKENVEIVRQFFDAVERSLDAWQRSSGSLVDAVRAGDVPPETEEVLGQLSPEMEWNPVFSSETYRGPLEIARGWDELLEATLDYHLELMEILDLESDRVFVGFGPRLEGRSSGIQVDAAVFAIVSIRGGLIVRMDEYTNRREALKAGLSE